MALSQSLYTSFPVFTCNLSSLTIFTKINLSKFSLNKNPSTSELISFFSQNTFFLLVPSIFIKYNSPLDIYTTFSPFKIKFGSATDSPGVDINFISVPSEFIMYNSFLFLFSLRSDCDVKYNIFFFSEEYLYPDNDLRVKSNSFVNNSFFSDDII